MSRKQRWFPELGLQGEGREGLSRLQGEGREGLQPGQHFWGVRWGCKRPRVRDELVTPPTSERHASQWLKW